MRVNLDLTLSIVHIIYFYSCFLKIFKQDNLTIYGSGNPGVFTDARCFMDWIAGQYRMRMPSDYIKPASCHDKYYTASIASRKWFMPQNEVFPGSGNVTDIYKEDCRGSFNYDYIDKNKTSKQTMTK